MKYAVIAAGEGSRLTKEGNTTPKPLIEVNGERLVDRLLRIFKAQGASEAAVICNEQMTEVKEHLLAVQQTYGLPLRLVVKSTPSSMHSMWELSRWLDDGPFVLTTVDTIFREEEFDAFVQTFSGLLDRGEADGLMGVTEYIDDEKPLYVSTDDDLWITAFLDQCNCPRYVSGGIYALTPRSLNTLQDCVAHGEQRMRNFQRGLLRDGFKLKAWPFSKVLDIDNVSDIQKAEAFLSEE
jgi:NDP-sugar pyrophosphorylase family protein